MPRHRAHLFDAMAADYDVLEPWYEHLYARLARPAARRADAPGCRARAARSTPGCGTGFQTGDPRRRWAGGRTASTCREGCCAPRASACRASPLAQGDFEALPYRDACFDAATCCGSTLSFVDDAREALGGDRARAAPGRPTAPRVRERWSLDLGWAWLSSLVGDPWGYELTSGEAWRAATTPARRECRLRYPGYGTLRLFTATELERLLRAEGLEPVRIWGIHSITNLLPSTVLHQAHLSRPLAAVYRMLRGADRALSARWPATRLANSLVALARKRPAPPTSAR